MNTRNIFFSFVLLFALIGCSGFSTGEFLPDNETAKNEVIPTPEAPLTRDIAQMTVATVNAAPIDSKDVYVDGHISIEANGTSATNVLEADAKLKGRGNFTWTLDKKPYKIKYASKTRMMGMPADKEWVLLANHVDKTLIRTAAAFEFSRRVGTEYSPRGDFVDLILNGNPVGSYMLTESVKIAPDRVNISVLSATDLTGEALTGGYLVELNERLDETVNWRSTRGVAYSLKEPSAPPVEQSDYIRNYMNAAETALYAADFADPVNGYAKYIDVGSFINLYLVHELFKNKDAANFSSIYLFKDRNQKLKMGPPWDFDLGGGNSNSVESNNPVGWWLRANSPWYSRLFEDPNFTAKVKDKWNAMKAAKIDTMDDFFDKTAYRMGISQKKNFDVWKIMGVKIFDEVTPLASYDDEVNFLKTWIKTRTAWIDQELNKP